METQDGDAALLGLCPKPLVQVPHLLLLVVLVVVDVENPRGIGTLVVDRIAQTTRKQRLILNDLLQLVR